MKRLKLKINIRVKLMISFFFIALMAVGMGGIGIYFTNYIGDQGNTVSEKLAPLGNAAIKIIISATKAHLLFEEIVSGNQNEDIQEVWDLLDEALWYSNAILNGAVNDKRIFHAVEDPQVRRKIEAVQKSIEQFIESTHQRYNQLADDSGVRSTADQKFDNLYKKIQTNLGELGKNSRNLLVVDLKREAQYLTANGHLFLEELIAGDEETRIEEINEDFNHAKQNIEKLGMIIGADAVANLLESYDQLIFSANERYGSAQNDVSAGSAVDQAFDQEFESFVKEAGEAEVLIYGLMQKGITNFGNARRKSLIWIIVISIAIVTIAFTIAFFTGRAIAGPLQAISVAAKKITKGDLSVEIPALTEKDEVGVLARSFSTMVNGLRKAEIQQKGYEQVSAIVEHTSDNIMFVDNDLKLTYMNPACMQTFRKLAHLLPCKPEEMIGMSIDRFHKDAQPIRALLSDPKNLPYKTKITFGSEVIFQSVFAIYDKNNERIGTMANWSVITEQERLQTSLDQTAQLVAATSEELSKSSQEMRVNAEKTTWQAKNVATISQQTNQSVQSVATAAQELSATAKDISMQVQEAREMTQKAVTMTKDMNKAIEKLNGSNMEIGKTIKVISTIAGSTNLLALNATIEAVRAGDAGKGFAVVANEVKTLSKETAMSTENIRKQITNIQNNTKETVDLIVKISAVIKQINEIAISIARAMEEQSATTKDISLNMLEAAKGTDEVTGEIDIILSAALASSNGADNIDASSKQFALMATRFVGLSSNNRSDVNRSEDKAEDEDYGEKHCGDVELF